MKTIILFALLFTGVSFAFAEQNHHSFPGFTPFFPEMIEARIRILPPAEKEETKTQKEGEAPQTDSTKPDNTELTRPHISLLDAGASV